MEKIERLPEAELDIMMVLWRSEIPLTVGEITKTLLETRNWKTSTVHVLMDRLGERGFVSCDKSGYKHLFSAIISEDDYRRREEHSIIRRFFGGSAKNMMVSLLNADSLSDDEIEELADILKRKKEDK
ncbi:MAG: BlaI/MecI/CopY family transcriptional regulator [Clostridia bacterium]|nr:BlaI/MecI/CopY family transcriptional regulator [Clostridia bacterium]